MMRLRCLTGVATCALGLGFVSAAVLGAEEPVVVQAEARAKVTVERQLEIRWQFDTGG